MKSTMTEVFSAIHDERVYQDRKWGNPDQHPHEVGGYITLMRKLLADAEVAWCTSRGDDGALDELRKVVAVGFACMEQHGVVERETVCQVCFGDCASANPPVTYCPMGFNSR
jgi:hypothetical protein